MGDAPDSSSGLTSLLLFQDAGDRVGRHHRLAVTRKVVEIGSVFPKEDLVSGPSRMNTVEVRNPGFVANFASRGRGGDMDYISLADRIDVATLINARRGLTTTALGLPAKGVDAESRDGSACHDGNCAQYLHGWSLRPPSSP